MHRRAFLQSSLVGGTLVSGWSAMQHSPLLPLADVEFAPQHVHSITPVIGDGKWIWTDPPEETGYLEPREYELEVGIEMNGKGSAGQLRATTPVPTELPEQKTESADVQTQGCMAQIRKVSNESSQLVLAGSSIRRGQQVSAKAKMRLTLFKQYHGFQKEQFDAKQPEHALNFRQQYLFDSPGIQVRAPQVRTLQKQITGESLHPWDQAHKVYQWVWENIHARIGTYTSVVRALKSRVGDCEERAACFVALCRSAGIPARLVWIPNHNWAEFYLVDSNQKGHWIPAHTAAYSWFGWTGAHELVLQKGDNLSVPEKRQRQRLIPDWAQWHGVRPDVRFTAHLRPIAQDSSESVGPGERVKDRFGKWVLQGTHQLDRSLRDGSKPINPAYPNRKRG